MLAPLAPLAGQGGTLGVKQGTKKIESIELFDSAPGAGKEENALTTKIDEVNNPEATYSLGITGIPEYHPILEMPGIKESDKWFLRITAPHTLLETKLKEMKEWIDIKRMAIAYHTGTRTGKEHIHIALEMLKEMQQQSINKRIKKLFGVSGADYASKIWDGSHKVLSYLYHDAKGKVEYFKMELTPEEMAEIQRVHEVYKDIVTTAKQKASSRIPDRILEEIKEGGETWTMRKIITRILTGVNKDEWYPPGQMMERYVQEIMIKQSPEDTIPALTDYYCQKFTYGL